MGLQNRTAILILLASLFQVEMTLGQTSVATEKPTTQGAAGQEAPREFGKSYDALRPEQSKLVDDFIQRYNQTTGSQIVAREAYDAARISVRTTFDAVTHALINANLTDVQGKSLGRAFDLVDAVDDILGEETDVGGDRQFRLYVYLKPKAFEMLVQSREFHRERDNTVYHKGFPICYRLKDGPPSIQISMSRDRQMADIDVDYRSSTFPKALFNGHLTAANSDVRAGNNLDSHDARWSGLSGWWRELFGSFGGEQTQASGAEQAKRKGVPLNPRVKASQGIDETAHDFFKSWVVDKQPNNAIAYFSRRSYPCLDAIASKDRKPIPPGMVRTRLRLSMENFIGSLASSKQVAEVFQPEVSWYPNLKEAKNSYAREFRLLSVSSDMGQDEECVAIPDEEASKKHKEKYYATVVRGMQGDSRRKVMSLLWTEEGKYWKIVALRLEDGSKAGIVPHTAAKLPPVQVARPQEFAGDPNAVKDITGFYTAWLVARKPLEAAQYASERSYNCLGPAAETEKKMSPAGRIRLGLARPLDKVLARKDLADMMFSSPPANEWVRPVEHANSKAFSIMAVPEQMADGFLCQKRTMKPADIEAKDAQYGKYYLSASQLNFEGEQSAALILLWAREKPQWKVIAWSVELP
jgi:hypothetical protein